MFEVQNLLEVYHSLKSYKVRSIFTGFGIMWAMVLFVLLQGGSMGFYNGMLKQFHGFTIPILTISPGYTAAGKVMFTEDLANNLAYNVPALERSIPLFLKSYSIDYEHDTYKNVTILGVEKGYEQMRKAAIVEGRFLTERDRELPVCLVGKEKKTLIFGNRSSLGELIRIGSVLVRVIGVIEGISRDMNNAVMVPVALFKELFPEKIENINKIMCTLKPGCKIDQVEKKIHAALIRQLDIEDQEKTAFWIDYPEGHSKMFKILFIIVQGFIGAVSLCFLISGVVNVGNMMLVVVQERMQELAIRKVIGASSWNIISLILLEAIVVHVVFGILGMGIGLGIIHCINRYLSHMLTQSHCSPFELSFSIATMAFFVLTLAGCFVGIIPAKKAWNIKPVDALNNE